MKEPLKTVNIPTPLYRRITEENKRHLFSSVENFIRFVLRVVGEIPVEEVRRRATGKLPREQGLCSVGVPQWVIDKYFDKNRVATWEVLEMYLDRFEDKLRELSGEEYYRLKKEIEGE